MKHMIKMFALGIICLGVSCTKQFQPETGAETQTGIPEMPPEQYKASLEQEMAKVDARRTKLLDAFNQNVQEVKLKAELSLPSSAKKSMIKVPGDYASIQEAVDNAAPGATIKVSGHHVGRLVIPVPGIEIHGVDGASIEPPDADLFWTIAIVADDVSVKGMHVIGTVVAQDCMGLSLKNNDIEGPGDNVIFFGVSTSRIQGNYIHNSLASPFTSGNGIWTTYSDLNNSDNNTIQANKLSQLLDAGINIGRGTGNIIRSNTVTEAENGIYLTSSQENKIQDNFLYENNYAGIWLIFSGNNTIVDAKSNLNGMGIALAFASNNHIKDVTTSDNSLGGINLVALSRSNIIQDATVLNNDGIGIYMGFFCFNNTVKNSTASGNIPCDFSEGTNNTILIDTNFADTDCSN